VSEKEPRGAGEQIVEPVSEENLPIGQERATIEASSLTKNPGGAGLQSSDALKSENLPAGQGVASVAPAVFTK
jgi:hypothetical protein